MNFFDINTVEIAFFWSSKDLMLTRPRMKRWPPKANSAVIHVKSTCTSNDQLLFKAANHCKNRNTWFTLDWQVTVHRPTVEKQDCTVHKKFLLDVFGHTSEDLAIHDSWDHCSVWAVFLYTFLAHWKLAAKECMQRWTAYRPLFSLFFGVISIILVVSAHCFWEHVWSQWLHISLGAILAFSCSCP